MKCRAVKIEVERWEGKAVECVKETFEGDDVWAKANATLGRWGRTAPDKGNGYDKCGFVVTYEDGDTYEGRYELTKEWPSLERHMREHCVFHAGRAEKPWMGEKRYRAYLAELVKPEGMANYARFLDGYEIGEEAPRASAQESWLAAMGVE